MLFASAAVVGGLTKLYAMTPKALIEVVSAFSTTGLLLGVTGQCEIQPLPVPVFDTHPILCDNTSRPALVASDKNRG
ncbi:MAG: hypothetical protein HZY76_10250 [Anaerolineae bacterium]|nr:MAG: hypothetical protein HZY76_10250 [Anaerolineae bacterium]